MFGLQIETGLYINVSGGKPLSFYSVKVSPSGPFVKGECVLGVVSKMSALKNIFVLGIMSLIEYSIQLFVFNSAFQATYRAIKWTNA